VAEIKPKEVKAFLSADPYRRYALLADVQCCRKLYLFVQGIASEYVAICPYCGKEYRVPAPWAIFKNMDGKLKTN